jgi:DNA-binding SARP family transcriptional activator
MVGQAEARVQLFGGLRLVLTQITICEGGIPTKTASLVKLLALRPSHTLHRDQLIDTLWPDANADRGANNLYKAVHRLRIAIPDADARDLVTARRKIVHLAPWATVDFDDFKAEAEAATQAKNVEAYERALSLSAGGLLPCDLYEDWTIAARTESESIVQQLHLGAAELCMLGNDRTRAAMHLQSVLAQDPVNTRAVQMLRDGELLTSTA